MGKGTIGVAVAIIVWAGGALSADAQTIQGQGPGPTFLSSGNAPFDAVLTLTSAPQSVMARFLAYRGTTLVHNSGWMNVSGTYLQRTISNLVRYAGETLTFKWNVTASGWTPLTVTWNCEVEGYYYGFGTIEEGAGSHGLGEEALVWLDPKSVGVMA